MDADSDLARDAPLRGAFLADSAGGILHFNGREKCLAALIRVSFRTAEDNQNRIADEFVDRAVVLKNGTHEGRKIIVEHLGDFIGLHPCREASETANVGTQNRDGGSLAAELQAALPGALEQPSAHLR